MFAQKILAGFVLSGLVGAVIASDANAQSSKVRACQQQCAGDSACIRECGNINAKRSRREAPPPTTPPWQIQAFGQGKDGGGGGGGGGGGR
jgi:hypothetical protein